MKQMRRYFLLISALVLICTACPAAASAAVKVKLKEQAFTENAETADQNAQELSTDQKYRIRIPAEENRVFGSGYVLFTAPKSGKYAFQFSGLKGKEDYSCGLASLLTESGSEPGTLEPEKFKTQGGYGTTLYLATENSPGKLTVSSARRERTAKLNLEKGQTLRIYLYFPAKSTVNLLISKVADAKDQKEQQNRKEQKK